MRSVRSVAAWSPFFRATPSLFYGMCREEHAGELKLPHKTEHMGSIGRISCVAKVAYLGEEVVLYVRSGQPDCALHDGPQSMSVWLCMSYPGPE